MLNDDYFGTEYWTMDSDGKGYCSTVSLEDAVIQHIREMNFCFNPHGPIVDIKIIRREVKEAKTFLSSNKDYAATVESMLEIEKC